MKYLYLGLIVGGMILAAPLMADAGQSGQKQPRHTFESCDQNKDGFLSREEFLGCWPKGAKKFDAVDKDGNGRISKQDIQKYRAERKAARQAAGATKSHNGSSKGHSTTGTSTSTSDGE